jgi:hypothetical protein
MDGLLAMENSLQPSPVSPKVQNDSNARMVMMMMVACLLIIAALLSCLFRVVVVVQSVSFDKIHIHSVSGEKREYFITNETKPAEDTKEGEGSRQKQSIKAEADRVKCKYYIYVWNKNGESAAKQAALENSSFV